MGVPKFSPAETLLSLWSVHMREEKEHQQGDNETMVERSKWPIDHATYVSSSHYCYLTDYETSRSKSVIHTELPVVSLICHLIFRKLCMN